jgi:uncharacterized membrane protein
MQFVLMIIGALAGLFLAAGSEELLGFGAGAALGYLLGELRRLQKKVRDLEVQARLAASASPSQHADPPPNKATTVESVPFTETVASAASERVEKAAEQPAASIFRTPLKEPEAERPEEAVVSFVDEVRPAGTVDKLLGMAKEWLTTGNVPVKLGIIVSFFGVAFLLRYAVDQGFLALSIEARYLAVSVIAAVLLAVGWRLRARLPVYALSLQGGGIGVLYLTLFAAFRLHQLVPSYFAFALLVVLTAAAGVLAVLQNSMALAVLGTVGGFLAPVLVSTGSGNHVGLFSYYLLLNTAVLGIAWYRPWRFLNVLGFVFTFGVATLWGYDYYRPELFSSTEPFLIAFFLFYQAIAILFALRQPPKLRGFVDGSLIFGTPVIAFALQSQLVADTEFGLAISAIVLAVFYSLLATWLHRRQSAALRMLIESFIALSIAFATVAIPLALDDRWTAAAWSLEGAALIWIGVRQRRVLAKLSGTILLGASGVAFAEHGWTLGLEMPFLNGNVLSGLLISVSSIFSARYLAGDAKPNRGQSLISAPILLWGIFWWGGTGVREIFDRLGSNLEGHAVTAFIALSVAVLAWLGRRYDWTAARRSTLAYLPILPVIAIYYLFEYDHVLAGVGTLSWLIAIVAHFGLLRAYDNGQGRIEGIWHFAGMLFLWTILASEFYWRLAQMDLAVVWRYSGMLLAPLMLVVAITLLREKLVWPLQRYGTAYLAAAAVMIAAQLFWLAGLGMESSGDPEPLPYVPVLNPFDMLTIVSLAVALHLLVLIKTSSRWLGQGGFRLATIVWAGAAFVLSTIAVVRGVHNLGDIGWRSGSLSASVAVQSALSIYWAILGFGGMIWGARNQKRAIWVVGTSLMALVVAKLFIVDLGNTGTIARIVSFLGVGALLLVVGYFAPAPPRSANETEA